MHDKIFPTPAIEAKHRRGLLGAHFDCFLSWMQEHGYSRHSIRFNIQCITHFGRYLQRSGIHSIHHLEGVRGQKLLVVYRRYWKRRGHLHRDSGIKLYIKALEEAGIIAREASNDFLCHEIRHYVTFLKNQKGFTKTTIQQHVYWIEKFLQFVGWKKSLSLPTFGIVDVDRFLQQEASRLKRSSKHSLTGALRGFLRFLYQSEKLATDLASLITSPRCYKYESLPYVLNRDEIQKILENVDRSMSTGPQYYAMLVLLTSYGLRAGEVARLKLEDIDWRKETIHIVPRKMGNTLLLPLIPYVGKAILEYLKNGRPSSKYREVFLITRAPWTPLTRNNVAYVVDKHIQLAGLELPRGGPHLFRHSFATHLIREGVPLKHIGDMLGHQAPESTYIYTKTATEQLREVALEVPEVELWKKE